MAVANGLPARHPITKHGWTTWFWDAPDLQASYLTTASVGDYELRYSKTDDGLPIIDAIDDGLTPANATTTAASLKLQPDMIAFLEETFQPYPFNSFGSIVDDDSVGYALETQTRPVYSRVASESTVVHELAHQWFGNAVSPERWQDIWLNEGLGHVCRVAVERGAPAATRPRQASTPSWRSPPTTRSGTWLSQTRVHSVSSTGGV